MQDRKYLVFEGTASRTTEFLNKYNSDYTDVKIEGQAGTANYLYTTISYKEKCEPVIKNVGDYISAKSSLLEYLRLHFDESAQISITLSVDKGDELEKLLEENQYECLVDNQQINNYLSTINNADLTDNDRENIDLFNKCKHLVDNFLIC